MNPRQYTKKYTFPDQEDNRHEFASWLCQKYKLVVAMGLPCTGKTTFLKYVRNDHGCLTVWSRATIFDMLFRDGQRDEKYNSYIGEFEFNVFKSLLERPEHKVCVEGWYRTRHPRLALRELAANQPAALLVFDGPTEEIVSRMLVEPRYSMLDPLEVRQKILNDHETMQWPTTFDGYDIVYINMFGEIGAEYLKQTVTQKVTE